MSDINCSYPVSSTAVQMFSLDLMAFKSEINPPGFHERDQTGSVFKLKLLVSEFIVFILGENKKICAVFCLEQTK